LEFSDVLPDLLADFCYLGLGEIDPFPVVHAVLVGIAATGELSWGIIQLGSQKDTRSRIQKPVKLPIGNLLGVSVKNEDGLGNGLSVYT
jgi:hypothetical protein